MSDEQLKAENARLLDEVERLRDQLHMVQGDALTAVGEVDALQSRLALLEPVWEAALSWHRIEGNLTALRDAIDAAVAKEGK